VPSPSEFSSPNMTAPTSFETSVINLSKTTSRPTRLESSTAKILFLSRWFPLVGVYSWGKFVLSQLMCFLRGQLPSLLQSSVTWRRSNEPLAEKAVILQATAQILTSSVNVAALSRKQKQKDLHLATLQVRRSESRRGRQEIPSTKSNRRVHQFKALCFLSVCLSLCRLSVYKNCVPERNGHQLALKSGSYILYSSANVNITASSSYITK